MTLAVETALKANNQSMNQSAKGSKTINVKTCCAEKSHFTIVQSCLAAGTRLKLVVIFKRKTKPKEKFPSAVQVEVHEKGWMDEHLTDKSINDILSRRPGAPLHK